VKRFDVTDALRQRPAVAAGHIRGQISHDGGRMNIRIPTLPKKHGARRLTGYKSAAGVIAAAQNPDETGFTDTPTT
jgi:hypothetical protein